MVYCTDWYCLVCVLFWRYLSVSTVTSVDENYYFYSSLCLSHSWHIRPTALRLSRSRWMIVLFVSRAAVVTTTALIVFVDICSFFLFSLFDLFILNLISQA